MIGGGPGLPPLATVTVLEVRDGRVRLGIEAPADVPIHRTEVWVRTHAK